METANDIEGRSTGLTLWFSGPRQVGTFVAECCSGARPLGTSPLRMLQPRSQYVALRPDDILAVQEWHMASEGMDTYSVCPTCRAKDLQVLSVTSTHQQYGNRTRAKNALYIQGSWNRQLAKQGMQTFKTRCLLALQARHKLADGLFCLFCVWPTIKKISTVQ